MKTLFYDLRAINPEKNVDRFYKMHASLDLFNTWTVRINYGRVGTKGRQKLFSFDSQEEACAFLEKKKKERLAFRKKRGCAYTVKQSF